MKTEPERRNLYNKGNIPYMTGFEEGVKVIVIIIIATDIIIVVYKYLVDDTPRLKRDSESKDGTSP